MKRKLSLVGILIWFLLTVYSVVAWWMLRGAGAYRIGTQLGGILSVSRQYTALAAVLLGLVLGISFLVWFIRKNKGIAAGLSAVQKRLSRKGKRDAGSTDGTLPPVEGQVPAQAQQATEKLRPRRGSADAGDAAALPDGTAAPDDTPVMPDSYGAAVDSETALLPGGGSPDDATALLPGAAPVVDDATVLLPAESAAPEKTRPNTAPAADGLFCPQCGAAVRAGLKFCTHCGCALKGESI